MLVSPTPSVQTVQLPPSAELDPTDPIWRHVKTDWDHQFVKRANFLPWLRAQLQIDPIDEASLTPEPLLCYVKRRFALAQSQQRLRETASHGQSTSAPPQQPASASTMLVQAPSNSTPNVSGTLLEPTQASPVVIQGSCPGNSLGFVSPQSDGALAANPVIDSTSDASHVSISPSTIPFSSKPPQPTSNAFSSQLGAIADAHMGNSSHMTPTSSSQPNNFHYSSNCIDGPQPYVQADAPAHQFPQSQALFMGQENVESNQQHSSQLSQFSSSLTSSAYVNHTAQSSPALAFAATYPHPLQPQNVNQYSDTSQPMQITQYEQFPDAQKKSLELQENAFAHSNQSFDFNGTAPASESGNWSSAPFVQIDPALMAGYETSYGLASQTYSQSIPPISPAIDVVPRAAEAQSVKTPSPQAQSVKAPSPRRTRSAAAMTKKAKSAATVPRPSATQKAPPTKKNGPRTANSSSKDMSLETMSNQSTDSPANKEASHKEEPNVPTNPSPSPPTDQYNRKAWKSRLASVRSELDHITKAPARSASKLVNILSMYSISPTPTSGDWSTVPPEGRIEVLSAMKAAVPQDFYSTWVSESKGLAMLEAWLKGSVHAHEKAKAKATPAGNTNDDEVSQRETLLVNLLQTLAKLPLALENLKNHAFAKQVLRINKDQNASKFSDAVKNLSIGLEQKWRAIVRGVAVPMARSGSSDSVTNPAVSAHDTKKRPEAAPDSNQSKRRKVEATRASAAATPSTSKGASDLFGRPDKAKLPAFTKKASEPTATPPVVTQDPFAEAMGLLIGKNGVDTSVQIMPSTSIASSNPGEKPSKRVKFAADSELCQIKIVERLVYEGEENETHPLGDARKMDAVEGRYLHQSESFLEEEIAWEAPSEVVLTSETITNLDTSPLVSAELAAQDEREKVVAGVTYEDESQIPDTPHEPGDTDPSTGGDTGSPDLPKLMKLGGNLVLDPEISNMIAKAQTDNSVNAPVAPDHTVSDLLARLGGGSGALPQLTDYASQPTVPFPTGFDTTIPPGLDVNLLNSLAQSGSLQAFLAASGNINLSAQPAPTTHTTDTFPATGRDNGWGAAAGSASQRREHIDPSGPYIPTGPSAGVFRNKRPKKRKDGNQPRMSAHDAFGRHIKCKFWPDCPHGNKCFYKHG
ncbi:hypothetical protein PCANC_13718 [Puccinia coronata f. sp. avenae]|nr:hypothetical protein PCANC_16141 [Puccinia coronata f. sp. avenae]PLW41916.1 hypothetical protein PCASD_12814 [Puccinia coronata f. sp. avenae]PLW48820.1 hypothetical protein PCANC_13718 [Puccinia coronata f. sp. avenae]